MKKMLLASVAALVLAAATPAFAADNHHGGGGHGHAGGGGKGGGGHGGGHSGGGGHGGGGHTLHAAHSFAGGGVTRSTHRGHSGGTTGSTHRGSANILSHGGNATAAGHRNRGGASAGRANPAFSALRRNVTAQRHFHHGSYQRPTGWYYRRWSYGDVLPSLFFARNYWLEDYNDFGLPYPPPGTVWVRYGDDALLVDEDSGEIIQVDYGIFY